MKKSRILLLLLIVLVISSSVIIVSAINKNEKIKAVLNGSVQVKFNGEIQRFSDANGKEVLPISYNGTTYLPVRAVSGLLGINVDYDASTNTVLLNIADIKENAETNNIANESKQTSKSETIQAVLNESVKVKYNGEIQQFKDANGKEVLPISYNGTTYLPVRAVSGLLEINVDYDANINTVLLAVEENEGEKKEEIVSEKTEQDKEEIKVEKPNQNAEIKSTLTLETLKLLDFDKDILPGSFADVCKNNQEKYFDLEFWQTKNEETFEKLKELSDISVNEEYLEGIINSTLIRINNTLNKLMNDDNYEYQEAVKAVVLSNELNTDILPQFENHGLLIHEWDRVVYTALYENKDLDINDKINQNLNYGTIMGECLYKYDVKVFAPVTRLINEEDIEIFNKFPGIVMYVIINGEMKMADFDLIDGNLVLKDIF